MSTALDNQTHMVLQNLSISFEEPSGIPRDTKIETPSFASEDNSRFEIQTPDITLARESPQHLRSSITVDTFNEGTKIERAIFCFTCIVLFSFWFSTNKKDKICCTRYVFILCYYMVLLNCWWLLNFSA